MPNSSYEKNAVLVRASFIAVRRPAVSGFDPDADRVFAEPRP